MLDDVEDTSPEAEVGLNSVGTFGVSSASYYWAREGGGISRAIIYLMCRETMYQLLYVNDYFWTTAGPEALTNLALAVW